jgi:hypothetical protein
MRRLLSALLLGALCVSACACGNVFIHGAILTSTVSGVVSVVHVTSVPDTQGSTVVVTFVTFIGINSTSTVGFCGDLLNSFPLNQTMRADFTPGPPCATIIQIVIT